jgi:phthalate 4,5-dioxygenase oxygenase subunit
MLSREGNDLITRTDNAAPLNELTRRYWLPALLSSELPDHGSKPVQVRLLNEELVAWRLADGSVGLLAEHCSHRGSSLVYARSEGDCLRCIYHGWMYDVGGTVLDTPAEPARSVIKDKVKHPSYATHEAAGGDLGLSRAQGQAAPVPQLSLHAGACGDRLRDEGDDGLQLVAGRGGRVRLGPRVAAAPAF